MKVICKGYNTCQNIENCYHARQHEISSDCSNRCAYDSNYCVSTIKIERSEKLKKLSKI